jgi:hypothetical protein
MRFPKTEGYIPQISLYPIGRRADDALLAPLTEAAATRCIASRIPRAVTKPALAPRNITRRRIRTEPPARQQTVELIG